MAKSSSSSSSLAKILVAVAIVAAVVGSAEGLTCGQVSGKLAGCINYARSNGVAKPPPVCCNGIRGLSALASTAKDRQDACNCLQATGRSIRGLNLKLVEGIPDQCGVKIPYKISPSTDCSRVR